MCWPIDKQYGAMIRVYPIEHYDDDGRHDDRYAPRRWYSQELCIAALYKAFNHCEEIIQAPDRVGKPVPYRWDRPFGYVAANDSTTVVEVYLYRTLIG